MTWRDRQHTITINRGKTVDTLLFPSTDSDVFHVRQSVKEMGRQSVVTYEATMPFADAMPVYQHLAEEALLEDVTPPNTKRQILGIIDGDDE